MMVSVLAYEHYSARSGYSLNTKDKVVFVTTSVWFP